jgi:hypothetical protein
VVAGGILSLDNFLLFKKRHSLESILSAFQSAIGQNVINDHTACINNKMVVSDWHEFDVFAQK